MENVTKTVALALGLACVGTVSANAAVISASGDQSFIIDSSSGSTVRTRGSAPTIISAPGDVNDDAAFNDGVQAFNEVQNFTLQSALSVDGDTIDAGTLVSSHMVFLNSGPGNSTVKIKHGTTNNATPVSFTFDGDILGVMSINNGRDEIASSSFLGAAGTIYPDAVFSDRGLEGNPLDGGRLGDWYEVSGATISLGFTVTEPGDWIRVITAASGNPGPVSPVPVPASMLLLGSALGGLGLMSRRRKRKTA